MTTAWPWPAPVDDGGASHLSRGVDLPDVELPSTQGSSISLRRLPGHAVIFIYPWTGRPGLPNPPDWDDLPGSHGSTPEAEGFRDHFAAFQSRRYCIVGMSAQPPEEQAEFALRLHLPYPLVSDHLRQVSAVLRLPTFETGGIAYLRRLTLIVAAGKIEQVIYPVHPPDNHARELLERLPA